MVYNFIKTAYRDFVFTITLARPEKRNAFTPTMVNELYHAVLKANEDKQVRVVVINAEGPVFCAGMDLKAFTNPENDYPNPAIVNQDISLGEVFSSLNKPSIAVVEGNVIAGGFLIVADCTYVFARPEVQFSLPEVKIGIFPFQVLASLLKIMPEKKAMQLCINGQNFSTERAIEIGLIDGYLEENVLKETLENLCANAPLAIQAGFESLKILRDLDHNKRYGYLLKTLNKLKESHDAQEGINALFEKRKPVWRNE